MALNYNVLILLTILFTLTGMGIAQYNDCRKCKELSPIKHLITPDKHIIFYTDNNSNGNDDEICKFKYQIELQNSILNISTKNVFLDQSGYKILAEDMCGEHLFKISAANDCSMSFAKNINVFIPPRSLSIQIQDVSTTEARLRVSLVPECLNLKPLVITCNKGGNTKRINATTTFLLDLKPFTTYECKAAIIKDGQNILSKEFVFTTSEDLPGTVRELTINKISARSFRISWKEPKQLPGILRGYQVTLVGVPSYYPASFCQNDNQSINETFTRVLPNAEFFELEPNYQFNVTIRAKTIDLGPEASAIVFTKTSAPGPVEKLTYKLLKETSCQPQSKVILNWRFPCTIYTSPENIVFVIHVYVNTEYERTILYQHTLVTDNVSVPLQLKPYTNYAMEVYAKNLGTNQTSSGKKVYFRTPEGAPSKVENLHIFNITESSFVVMWKKPVSIPGVLTEYAITVGGKPFYDAPTFCSNYTSNYYNTTVISIGKTNVYKFTRTFDDLPGNFQFNVVVRAKTVEYGPNATITVTTKTPSPRAVEKISYDIEMVKANEPTAILQWQYPCELYTSPGQVVFELRTFANSTLLGNPINITYDKRNITQNITKVLSLQPSTDYSVLIHTINLITNQLSTVKRVSFQTAKAITSAPLNVSFVAGARDIKINWQRPDIIYGDLQYYQVNISSLGPQHKLNCEMKTLGNVMDETTDTFYKYANLLPNRKYLIEIYAVTSKMVGDVTKKEVATTATMSPEPTNLTCHTYLDREDNYSLALNIGYSPPCDTNGRFDHYLISLTDEQGNVVTHTEQTTNYTVKGLKYEGTYKVGVLIVNEDNVVGAETSGTVTTPSGIPAIIELSANNVIAEVYGPTVDVRLERNYFSCDRGEIKYFALLVGKADTWDFGIETNGTWDGENWPSLEYWNEVGWTYQATPSKWNPLQEFDSFALFKLGNDSCLNVSETFCNGPLEVNTQYFLAIRAYTSNGFQTSNVVEFISEYPGLLAGISMTKFSILCVLLVLGIVLMIGIIRYKIKSKAKCAKEDTLLVNRTEKPSCLINNSSTAW